MKCDFYYYYSSKTTYQSIFDQVSKFTNNLFITNRIGLKAFFEKNGLSVMMIDDIMPEPSEKALKAYVSAKKIQNEYRENFQNLVYNNVSAFIGYEYDLLRRLTFLIKAKEVLKEKRDIIFIFEEFHPTYYSVLNFAKEIGFENDEHVRYITGNKIDKISYSQLKEKLEKKHYPLLKIKNFINSNTRSGNSKENFLTQIRFFSKLISFGFKTIFVRKFLKNDTHSILKKFDDKLSKMIPSEKLDTIFFITAVREDLYIDPWRKVWENYGKNNKNYTIITSDLSSGITLDKQKLRNVNIFEVVNLLEMHLRNTSLGNEIIKKFSEINEKSLIGINELSVELLNKTFRSMAIIILIEQILKKFNVNSIVSIADGEMLENIAVEVCKKYQIPSYTALPAVINPLPLFSDWFHAEKIFTYGEHASMTLKNLGYDDNRFILTGSLKYDSLKKYNPIEAKEHLQCNNHIDKNKKLIVIAMSKWGNEDEKWLPRYIEFCNKNDFELIIKLHPKYKNRNREISDIKVRQIKKISKKFKFHIIYEIDLNMLLSASDLVVSDYSNVLIEAALANKPLIMANFMHENWSDFPQRLDKYGASMYTEDYNELENISKEILVQNLHVSFLNEGRKNVIKNFNYLNDGKASERIFKLLVK